MDEGRSKCSTIQQRMFKALEKLLHKRLKPSEVHRILGDVRELNEKFESIEDRFLTQYTENFTRNRNLKFPRLFWELLPLTSLDHSETDFSQK